MRRPARSALLLGLLAGVVLALARVLARPGRQAPAPLAAPARSLPAPPPADRTPVPVEVATTAPTTPAPPAPTPPRPVAGPVGPPSDPVTGSVAEPSWVAAVEGACPDGYPIKAKQSSGIYHQPGGLSYERTRPDRCYRDAAAAEADGYRAAKR